MSESERVRTTLGLALALTALGAARADPVPLQARSGQASKSGATGPAAAAAGESPRQNKAAPATAVSGLTVTLSKATPHVVSTFPAKGSSVPPGVLVLRVTFDQPMFGDSWSYVTNPNGRYPDCAAAPRRLDDRKSFALICRTQPKTHYALWVNRAPYDNFVNYGRRPATPYLLTFSTSDDDPTWTLADAMKLDPGLPPGSNPAEPEGKRRPGEDVDIEGAPPPAAPAPGATPVRPVKPS